MSVTLGHLVVDAVNPAAAQAFWAETLGGPGRRALLRFRREQGPKVVKNRVHLDVYVRDIAPLMDLGARVVADYSPERMTLADVEGNEFCAFIVPSLEPTPPARAFAVCTDSDRPEELASWWAQKVGADVRDGPDGTPRWLYGSAGWDQMVWKFVRVEDERVVPNRWRWTVYDAAAGEGEFVDPQGNEFSVRSRGTPRTSDGG